MRPPPASEALLKLIDEAQSEMRDLVRKNSVDKAADMAITILSVVDDNDKLKQDETVRCMSIANETFLAKITGTCGVRVLAMDTNSARNGILVCA